MPPKVALFQRIPTKPRRQLPGDPFDTRHDGLPFLWTNLTGTDPFRIALHRSFKPIQLENWLRETKIQPTATGTSRAGYCGLTRQHTPKRDYRNPGRLHYRPPLKGASEGGTASQGRTSVANHGR